MSTQARVRDLRLNLGCGNEPLAGFLNVDLDGEGADLLMDARRLAVADRSVTALRACHLLEHLGYVGGSLALTEWYRVLKEGAELTIETPDLPKSMECFLDGDLETRARLINWIYGLESRGMGHRIGFELAALESMLGQAGFVEVRSEPPRCHPAFPGLRVSAVKRRSPGHDVRSELLRRMTDAGPSFGDQAVMLELIDTVVPDVASVFSDPGDLGARLAPVVASLVVYHVSIARMVVELSRPYLSVETFDSWLAALHGEDVALLGARLTAELLSQPIRPGAMETTFREVRDQGRELVATLLESDRGTGSSLDRSRSSIVVEPFSREGLVREAWRQHGRGARFFGRGDLAAALRHLELAARLNSDQPVLFWNLARLAAARGDRAVALERLDQAIIAAEPVGESSLLDALRDELAVAKSGRELEPSLLGPSSLAVGGCH